VPTGRSLIPLNTKETGFIVTLGIDAHKRTHIIVAVDEQGRQLASKTVGTNTKDHLALLTSAEQFSDEDGLSWAIEDCRHLSRGT
jgi:hypothetical protein